MRLDALVVAVWIAAPLLFVHETGLAQQKFPIETKGEGQTGSKYTQQLAIDVGDLTGHQIRVVEIKRTYSEETKLAIMGVRVKESWLRGLTDYVNGSGPAHGYTVWMLEDGEKIFLTWDSVSQSEPTSGGSRRGSSEAVTRISGGTGKYKGIRGEVVPAIWTDFPSL